MKTHTAKKPPSTGKLCPLTKPAPSLNKYKIPSVISSTSANRPNGVRLRNILDRSSVQYGMPIGVITAVGLTLLTRIPRGPSSLANERVNASTAAFDALYKAKQSKLRNELIDATFTMQPPSRMNGSKVCDT